jgi:hypothetical protein
VSVRGLARAWNDFFFKPQPPTPVALYRILYGLLVIANLILLRPDWLTWYGPEGFVSLETMRLLAPGPRMNIFLLLPHTALAVNVFFWIFLLFAVCLTGGFMTRFSAIAVYICLSSIQDRNPYILHSGDTLLRVTGFFLMFAPAGAALSIDRLVPILRGRANADSGLYAPWAQRLIQIQVAVLYFATFYSKTLNESWKDGTALYYVLRLDEFHHFPVPLIHNMFLLKALAWTTLLIEFSLGVMVWFRELRYPVLLAGVCMHLGIEYSMNIPLFEWIAISTYVTFIDPADLSGSWAWFRSRIGSQKFGARWIRLTVPP